MPPTPTFPSFLPLFRKADTIHPFRICRRTRKVFYVPKFQLFTPQRMCRWLAVLWCYQSQREVSVPTKYEPDVQPLPLLEFVCRSRGQHMDVQFGLEYYRSRSV